MIKAIVGSIFLFALTASADRQTPIDNFNQLVRTVTIHGESPKPICEAPSAAVQRRVSHDNFCIYPIHSLCENPETAEIEQENMAITLKWQNKAMNVFDAKKKRGLDPDWHTVFKSIAKTEQNFAMQRTLRKHGEIIKQDFINVIRTEISSEAHRDSMVQLIKNIRIVHDLNEVEKLPKSVKKEFDELCGASRISLGAAYVVRKGIQYLLVCPNHVLRSKENLKNDRITFASILFTLGHEMAHAIDVGAFPVFYDKYIACLQEVASVWSAMGGDENLDIEAQSRELIADFWAVKMVARYLDQLGPAMTRQEKLSTLRQSLMPLCSDYNTNKKFSLSTAKDHPSYYFRLTYLLRRDPQITRLMECNEPTKMSLLQNPFEITHDNSPRCNLEGIVR